MVFMWDALAKVAGEVMCSLAHCVAVIHVTCHVSYEMFHFVVFFLLHQFVCFRWYNQFCHCFFIPSLAIFHFHFSFLFLILERKKT